MADLGGEDLKSQQLETEFPELLQYGEKEAEVMFWSIRERRWRQESEEATDAARDYALSLSKGHEGVDMVGYRNYSQRASSCSATLEMVRTQLDLLRAKMDPNKFLNASSTAGELMNKIESAPGGTMGGPDFARQKGEAIVQRIFQRAAAKPA